MATRIIESIRPDGKLHLSNILSEFTGNPLTYTETDEISSDGQCRKPLYRKYKGRYVKMDIKSDWIDVAEFGAKENKIDNTTAIQSALDSGFKNVSLGVYKNYSVTGLKIPEGVNLIGNRCKIFNYSTHKTILQLSSKSSIAGFEIFGAGFETVNTAGIAVGITGADAINRLTGIKITDIKINSVGFYGVYALFCKDVQIRNLTVDGVGYAGFLGLSVEDVYIYESKIKTIVGYNSNAYGVAFSRTSESTDLVKFPRSKNCYVFDTEVRDNPLWEAFDTHGGDNINFVRCQAYRVKVGFALVSSQTSSGSQYAPQNCRVQDCYAEGLNTGSGVVVAGAANVVAGEPPLEYAANCYVTNNTLKNFGEAGNNINGGIRFTCTENLIVDKNKLDNISEIGINVYSFNKNYSVINNTVDNVFSATYSAAPCISVRTGLYNTGKIYDNDTSRSNPVLATYVSERGVTLIDSNTNVTDLRLGRNQCPVPHGEILNERLSFLSLGGKTGFYRVNGNPNGQISAVPGSFAYNINSGGIASFWIKESGTLATGWVPFQTIIGRSAMPLTSVVGTLVFDTANDFPRWWNGSKFNRAHYQKFVSVTTNRDILPGISDEFFLCGTNAEALTLTMVTDPLNTANIIKEFRNNGVNQVTIKSGPGVVFSSFTGDIVLANRGDSVKLISSNTDVWQILSLITKAEASPNSATDTAASAVGAAPTKAEYDKLVSDYKSLFSEVRDLKVKLKKAGQLA